MGGYLVKESDKNIGLYEALFDTVMVKTRNKYSFYLKLRLAKMSSSFVRCVLKYLTFEKMANYNTYVSLFYKLRESS